MSSWLSLLLVALALVQLCAGLAHLVKLHDAVKDGAMCLDGSPQAYYYRKGYGKGAKKWIVHLGANWWCTTEAECVERSKTRLGSSKHYPRHRTFGGLLSGRKRINTNFYNWNMVYVQSCDGGSFLGNVIEPVDVNGTIIHFRGFKNLQAVLRSLKKYGSRRATDFILTGCSAGGIATYALADYVHSQLSPDTKYAIIGDAGIIPLSPALVNLDAYEEACVNVHAMMNTSGALNPGCISAYPPVDGQWRCMIIPWAYRYIGSQVFSVTSKYDTWQLKNILKLDCLPPSNCSDDQKYQFNRFGIDFMVDMNLGNIINSNFTNGVWVDACLHHCQTLDNTLLNQIKVDGQTISETINYWYYKTGGGKIQVVDGDYPSNDSC